MWLYLRTLLGSEISIQAAGRSGIKRIPTHIVFSAQGFLKKALERKLSSLFSQP